MLDLEDQFLLNYKVRPVFWDHIEIVIISAKNVKYFFVTEASFGIKLLFEEGGVQVSMKAS